MLHLYSPHLSWTLKPSPFCKPFLLQNPKVRSSTLLQDLHKGTVKNCTLLEYLVEWSRHSFQLCGKGMIRETSQHISQPPQSSCLSFSTGQFRVLSPCLGPSPGSTTTTRWITKLKNCIANIYHSKQNVHMVPQMGGFPKTFRCIAAALLHKSTAGNLIERTFLLTELFVHRHVFDSFRVERNAAVFKITSFAIACQLSCRLIVDAATPCGTGFCMVFLHWWFELFGMKILMIGTNGCHQHQGKEHHSHHDHWSNKEVAVGTKAVQNMAGHLALDQLKSCNVHNHHKHGSWNTQKSKEKCWYP